MLDLLGGLARERLPAIASLHGTKSCIEEMAEEIAVHTTTGLHGAWSSDRTVLRDRVLRVPVRSRQHDLPVLTHRCTESMRSLDSLRRLGPRMDPWFADSQESAARGCRIAVCRLVPVCRATEEPGAVRRRVYIFRTDSASNFAPMHVEISRNWFYISL